MKPLGCVSLLACFLSPVKINAMPHLFWPFLLGKIYSSNFSCKGKDLIHFGVLAGAQKYLPLCARWTHPARGGWCADTLGSLPPVLVVALPQTSGAPLPNVRGLWVWGGGCAAERSARDVCWRGFWGAAACCYAAVRSSCMLARADSVRSAWPQVLNTSSRQATVSDTNNIKGKTGICIFY